MIRIYTKAKNINIADLNSGLYAVHDVSHISIGGPHLNSVKSMYPAFVADNNCLTQTFYGDIAKMILANIFM